MVKTQIKLVKASLKNVRVIDGDTIDGQLVWWRWLKRSTLQTRVRLAGIDAPEMKPEPEPYAEEATRFLVDRIEGRSVTVQFAIHRITKEWGRESGGDWDRKRLLGIIYKGWGKSLNVALVRKGLAKIYPSPTWMVGWFEKQLHQAEQTAQQKQRGVWALTTVRRGGNRFLWFCYGAIGLLLILILWSS